MSRPSARNLRGEETRAGDPVGATTGDRVAGGPGLADAVLTDPRRAGSPRAWWRAAVDRLIGSDPGLNQLRTALQAVLSIGAGLGLAALLVRLTGALQRPSGSAPASVLADENHRLLLVAMLLAAIVAFQVSLLVHERTGAGQALWSLLFPPPMAAGLIFELLLGPFRVASLVFLVLGMTVAVYLRRFGQRGLAAGNAVFFGVFFGFFLKADLGPGDAGWILALLGTGALAALLVRLVFFRIDPDEALARMRRSQRARARGLLGLSAAVLRVDDPRRRERLADRIRRQLARVNETTLMIDAQLPDAHPRTAAVEAQRSFDAELGLSNSAGFAVALADRGAPAAVRRRAAGALTALLHGQDLPTVRRRITALLDAADGDRHTAVLAHRLAGSLEQYATARDRLDRPIGDDEIASAAGGDFTPAVRLVNGWLPGSTPVSTEASATPGGKRLDRAALPPHLRATVQIAVAGTLSVLAGNALSGARVYWAVLTVYVCFLNVTNSGEEVRRALLRAGGTAVGIVLGDLFVHLTGANVWATVSVVLVAMFFGVYLIRVNYLFLTIGITVLIAELYAELGEFGWPVLLQRLGETAIGAVAVLVTAVAVLPLRPQRVLATALLRWFRALRALVEALLDRLDGLDGTVQPVRPLVRSLDAAYAALVDTATPLRHVTLGRTSTEITGVLAVSSATRQYARSLAAVLEGADFARTGSSQAAEVSVRAAADQMRTSLAAIEQRLATGEPGEYVRSASPLAGAAVDLARRHSPLASALKDFTLLDAALARLAGMLQMAVTDMDMSPRGRSPAQP